MCLGSSPFSVKTVWALGKLEEAGKVKLAHSEHVPFVGQLALRSRLAARGGNPITSANVTVPVLFTAQDGAFWDSWDIIEWANAADSSLGLVPAGRAAEVREWDMLADNVASFGRFRINDYGDGVTLKLLPWPLGSIPLLRDAVAAFTDNFVLSSKYNGTDGLVTEQDIAQFLQRADAALEAGPFILGGDAPSYADISVAVAIETLDPTFDGGCVFTALAPNLVESTRHLIEPYPRLKRWKEDLFRDHFPRAKTSVVRLPKGVVSRL